MKDKTIALRIKNLPIINKMNKIGDIYHGSSYVTCSLSLCLSVYMYLFSIDQLDSHSPSFSKYDIICKSLGLYLARWHGSISLSPVHHDRVCVSSSTPGGRSPRSLCRPPSHPQSPPGSSPCCRGLPAPLQYTRLAFKTIVMGTKKNLLNYSICIKIPGLNCKSKSTLVPPRCN